MGPGACGRTRRTGGGSAGRGRDKQYTSRKLHASLRRILRGGRCLSGMSSERAGSWARWGWRYSYHGQMVSCVDAEIYRSD